MHDAALSCEGRGSVTSLSQWEQSSGGHVVAYLYIRLARLPPRVNRLPNSAQYPDIARLKPS